MLRKTIFLAIITIKSQFSFGQHKRIYLLNEGTGANRHIIYIENNRQSNYYNLIAGFKLNKYDAIDYNDELTHLKTKKNIPLQKRNLSNFPLKWCSLRLYKNDYYVYSPSDYGYDNYHISFNDTTSIEAGFEIFASVILKLTKNDDHTYTIVRKAADKKIITTIVHIIDKQKGIAVFDGLFSKNNYRFTLMVEANKIRKFPLIINYCKSNRADEWQFDKPNFKALLAGKVSTKL